MATGDWWCSLAAAAGTGALLLTPSFSGAHLTWWQKRRLTDGHKDREWSYSATPGSQAMEQLWEHFREASSPRPGLLVALGAWREGGHLAGEANI